MKNIIVLMIAIVFIGSHKMYAQGTQDNSIKLQDLQLTNAPVFNLLDISPSSIDNPASTKAFAASILSAINQGSGIPQNYALEFTPFWYTKHPKYTSYTYFGVKSTGENMPFSQARLFSVSFAFINKDSTTNYGKLANHNAGLGVRTTLIRFFSRKTRDSIQSVSKDWYNSLKIAAEQLPTDVTQADVDKIQKILAARAHASSYGEKIKTYLQEKPLFSLNIAAATNMTFENNSFNGNRINRSGIWMDADLALQINKKDKSGKAVGPSSNYFNLSAVIRYINDKDSLDAQKNHINANLFDYGLKAEFQIGKLSLAYEYIRRTSSLHSESNTYKSVGILHYKIRDGLFITGAFGQNFSRFNNLISTLGINLGLSNGSEKIDDKE